MGGPENIAILRVGGPENFVILSVGCTVRPPQVIVYGENSVGGWSKKNCNFADGWSDKNCNSAGGWSEMSSVVTPTTIFFNEITLRPLSVDFLDDGSTDVMRKPPIGNESEEPIFEHTCAYARWAVMHHFLSVCLSVT